MTTRDVRWKFHGPRVWVDDGRTFVPSRVTVTGLGHKASGTLRAEFEVRNGVPECIVFSLEAVPGGRGIRTPDLRGFDIDGLVVNAFLGDARRVPEGSETGQAVRPNGERERWALRASLERARRGGRGRSSEAELIEVARVYLEDTEGAPTMAVANELNYSDRTAARRVSQARALGLLPAAPAKKKG